MCKLRRLHHCLIHRYTQVLAQKRGDKNKIYALHEPHIYAMAKGKDHKSYEYGTKASIATTYTEGIIVGVSAHKTNEHDSKTLQAVLEHASTHRIRPIEKATCDRGYRGVAHVGTTHICIPGIHLKRDTQKEKERLAKEAQDKIKDLTKEATDLTISDVDKINAKYMEMYNVIKDTFTPEQLVKFNTSWQESIDKANGTLDAQKEKNKIKVLLFFRKETFIKYKNEIKAVILHLQY
mgnify:CR=1 FL=1